MRCLGSQGCAPHSDPDAFQDLLQRHPQHDLSAFSEDLPAPLAIDSIAVLTALRAFPRGKSPGTPNFNLSIYLTHLQDLSTSYADLFGSAY